MPDTVLYTAEAVSDGDGRNGHVATSDGKLDLDLAFPPEMGGTGAGAPRACQRVIGGLDTFFGAHECGCVSSSVCALKRE